MWIPRGRHLRSGDWDNRAPRPELFSRQPLIQFLDLLTQGNRHLEVEARGRDTPHCSFRLEPGRCGSLADNHSTGLPSPLFRAIAQVRDKKRRFNTRFPVPAISLILASIRYLNNPERSFQCRNHCGRSLFLWDCRWAYPARVRPLTQAATRCNQETLP